MPNEKNCSLLFYTFQNLSLSRFPPTLGYYYSAYFGGFNVFCLSLEKSPKMFQSQYLSNVPTQTTSTWALLPCAPSLNPRKVCISVWRCSYTVCFFVLCCSRIVPNQHPCHLFCLALSPSFCKCLFVDESAPTSGRARGIGIVRWTTRALKSDCKLGAFQRINEIVCQHTFSARSLSLSLSLSQLYVVVVASASFHVYKFEYFIFSI